MTTLIIMMIMIIMITKNNTDHIKTAIQLHNARKDNHTNSEINKVKYIFGINEPKLWPNKYKGGYLMCDVMTASNNVTVL